jgi:hypothetical protein
VRIKELYQRKVVFQRFLSGIVAIHKDILIKALAQMITTRMETDLKKEGTTMAALAILVALLLFFVYDFLEDSDDGASLL